MKSQDNASDGAGTTGSGYVAGVNTGALHAVMAGGTMYQALDSSNGGFAKNGSDVEPFQVELLSDVEGSSEIHRPSVDEEAGYAESDRWMRNIWSEQNRAVVLSYFCVGFATRFLVTPISYYLVHVLESPPAEQNVLFTLSALPWSFKLVYGFISDNFPIRGMRRKPYFIIGWSIYVLVNLYTASKETPSIQLLAAGALTSSMGFMLSDVTTDAILVERSKHEPKETRGSMQAIGYSVRFVGSLLGSVMGMLLYNKDSWGWGLSIQQLFFLNGIFPVVFLGPWVRQLRETGIVSERVPVMRRLEAQCTEVFRALEQRAVYVPMGVIFLYNLFQVPNAAWRSFLVDGLEFSSFQLGILSVVGSLMASLGLLAYKQWFFHSSWRKLYVWTTLVVTFFSAFQIVLILRVNTWFGIPDLAFSIGDDSIADFVSSIQFLPVVQMYICMCPDGAEGTTYAILTTMANVSMAAAFSMGTLFTRIWDVSNEAFIASEFSGMWKLTLLTSLIQPLPLFLIRWLPDSQAEQQALQKSGIRRRSGGIALLVVLFASLFYTIGLSIKELSG